MRRKPQPPNESSSANFRKALDRRLAPGGPWSKLLLQLRRLWTHMSNRSARQADGLRLVEMVGLGEKRFVAVVEYQHERFMLGGAPAGVCLLSRLHNTSETTDTSATAPAIKPKRKARRAKELSRHSSVDPNRIVALLDPASASSLAPERKSAGSALTSPSIERLA